MQSLHNEPLHHGYEQIHEFSGQNEKEVDVDRYNHNYQHWLMPQ